MKTKLKQLRIFSDIFNLKSKFLTFVLGIIVPFFAAHIFAHTATLTSSKVKLDPSKKSSYYRCYLLISILYISVIYAFCFLLLSFLFCLGVFNCLRINLYFIFLIVYLLINLFYTLIYYSYYKEYVLKECNL